MVKWVFIVASLLLVTALGADQTEIPADLEAFIETRDPGEVSKEPIGKNSTETLTEEQINEQLKKELGQALVEPETPTKIEITSLFSPEENPGSGTLIFTQGERGEEIKLGLESGYYAYGLVFRSDLLPQPHRHNFGNKLIIQVSFGTVRSKLVGRIPQFGALTLFAQGIPEIPRTFVLRTQPKSGSVVKTGAVMLLSSPSSMQEQSDEEKLRGSYFAKGGKLIVTPMGALKVLSTGSGKEKLKFNAQAFEFQFEASMMTPFNNQVKGGLDGKINIPLYWPANKAARELLTDLAVQSLDDTGPLPERPPASVPRKR
ncbi:MAG: hypothetical protein H6617_07550 [Bdellovibrionaceae bacterium]|nr:hypothetical protein [Bdellovibrionales bacterium]MCB9254521.1 hypothetical protein [Pseudobdellovibrionaceae bacterium]